MKLKLFKHTFFALVIALFVFVSPPLSADAAVANSEVAAPEQGLAQSIYSPYAGRDYPTQVLWGDTHLHTSLSLDARAFGATLSPEDAYRFARGEEITSTHGERLKLSRPLDWLVVADHSDALGAMNEIVKGNPNLLKDPVVKDWYDKIMQGGKTGLMAVMDIIKTVAGMTEKGIPAVMLDKKFVSSIWSSYLDTAEQYNDPGRFSTIIGYEWTATEDGNNLHRNVLYRDGAVEAKLMLPFTDTESSNPEDLWAWMETYEEKTGGKLLALAHNGNLSNGIMFPEINPETGKPLTAEYAKQRSRWEPLYEVTQIKGDGEAHPYLSPNDEFADYETWEKSNFSPAPKQPWMLQYEYAREALKNGLKFEQQLGTNPYKFGMLGSTDSHTGLPTADEDNFFGKHSQLEPQPQRWSKLIAKFGDIKYLGWEQASSGYAAVWARENTREAIFDAMQRKEVYGTTGPRMTVRFFGGWDYQEADARQHDLAGIGYQKGVPMGGDLTQAPDSKALGFLVAAMKDPSSGNLDRIQVVKGWLDAGGKTQEKVYDVAWGDAKTRQPGADGKLPSVGNTVDVASATWSNTIGAAELRTFWQDPDFDSAQRAFYYARVIEIPTPRWTAYDAARYQVDIDPKIPMITQERAYTSPIWYTP